MSSKLLKDGEKKLPPAAGKGRVKGVPNKNTKALKEMILGALEQSGGVEYLVERANDPRTASAFLSLVGKVLPMTVASDENNPLVIHTIKRVIVESNGP